MFRKLGVVVWLSGLFISSPGALPQTPQAAQAAQSSLTLDEVVRLIKQYKKDPQQVASVVAERGVDFDLDGKTQKKLQKAGADDQLLGDIWKVTPAGKTAMRALLTSPTGAELQASPGEVLALQNIENEMDVDRQLRMVDEFEKKFPGSQLLSYVYTQATKAYEQKGAFDKVIEYGEKSLKLDPDNTFTLVVMAVALPQPKMLQGSKDEVNRRLAGSEADANRALTLLEKLKKEPNETDEQFQARKGSLAADAHFALGMVAVQRDEYDKAVAQYNTAISSSTKPSPQYYYRLGEAYANEGQTGQAIEVLRKTSDLARGTPMQKYADDFIAELQRKSH